MQIVLEDNDSSASSVTIPVTPPLEKYPLPECHALHALITPEKLTKLVDSALKQASDVISSSKNHETPSDSSHILLDYDIIIESERGVTLFGFPLFSHQLFPMDPPRLMTPHGTKIMSTQLYPLPSDLWRWGWAQWHVVMDAGDMDDQGWSYAWWFKAKSWRGRMKTGCVRRRIWMRVRWRPTSYEQQSS
ncbi:CYFA0S15e02520g1_1 [Cyberlindnera fabianii]|uniref:CYFA0S15e02520g1_1 n=1 Tax=Cyberlindnera fabianii TaxID=36022 RepID=A0A061B5J0_CYBFA|nr:Sporulation-specific protein 73 [Cyberlindnera fabianii]CDR44759.1 CYFA0S15e02520g1_1 [Cyberlindnera fabianii]